MEARRTYPAPVAPGLIIGVGFALIGGYVWLLFVLMDRTKFDIWGAALVAPALLLISVPILWRQAIRESDPATFRLLFLALLLKLAGAVLRYYVAFTVYGGQADATRYHNAGVTLATSFRHLDFSGLHLTTGTKAIDIFTGIGYAIIGPTKVGGFLLFSWIGFWGLYLFYRAFVLVVPMGNRRSYAHLLFFMPSLLFWPSSIGKEAWMMFTIGIAVYGVAVILKGATIRGLVICASGLWLTGLVRPHMAALVAVSLALAFVTRKSKKEHRELAPILRIASIVVVAVLAGLLVSKSQQFLTDAGIDTSQGVTTTLGDVQSRTSNGGSTFTPSIVGSPAGIPVAIVTVVFRPFVWEAQNAQSLLAAIEGTFLLLLFMVRFRWLLAALRALPKAPFVVFSLVYSAAFIVAFSSFANFGLLARQRVQLYPLFFVLMAIPPVGSKQSQAVGSERSQDAQEHDVREPEVVSA